jgi:hypothetical protein
VGQGFVRPGEPVRPVPDESHSIHSHSSAPIPQQGT